MSSHSGVHLINQLERALAGDERTHELGIRLRLAGDRVIADGEVASEARRRQVIQVLEEQETGLTISDQLTLSAESVVPTHATEVISDRREP